MTLSWDRTSLGRGYGYQRYQKPVVRPPPRKNRRVKKYSIGADQWRYFSFDYNDFRSSMGLLNPGTKVRNIICSNTRHSNPDHDYVMIVTDSKILQFEMAELIIKFNNSVVA